ncbi:hypothetical protein AYI68_g3069 [Smittium mucronatum]|uniref:Uncharacterized protein n=1 Tax=Smittium mucronatum TaxID=133383 RepID=A0A1R0H0Z1_9FUNG|nr:hypothetical protein AYI68_g3069 [Smittium mucronatum]
METPIRNARLPQGDVRRTTPRRSNRMSARRAPNRLSSASATVTPRQSPKQSPSQSPLPPYRSPSPLPTDIISISSSPLDKAEQISAPGSSGSEATEPPRSRKRTSHYQSARLPQFTPPRNLNVSAVVSRQPFNHNEYARRAQAFDQLTAIHTTKQAYY